MMMSQEAIPVRNELKLFSEIFEQGGKKWTGIILLFFFLNYRIILCQKNLKFFIYPIRLTFAG